ncbi:hypothetical protein EDB86DRAFT_2830613 [Lactarius hatsudake]|nr:hypothetical protein EDB86DRAFT_2830613 [Lactarius hatsudake]
MSQRSQLPPISHLQAIADHRVAPEPFDLPSPQPNTQELRIGSSSSGPQSGRLSHPHFRSLNSTQSTRDEPRFWTVSTAIHHNASSFWNAWGKSSSASPPSSRGRQPRPQRIPVMAHRARLPTTPRSYIAEVEKGNVGDNYIWNELYLAQLAELEPLALRGTGEKGRAFWKVWVDFHEPGLDLPDKAEKYRFIARALRAFPWYKGEESLEEATQAMERFDELHKKLAARKPTPGVTVMEFLEAEQRRGAQAAAQAQAQRQGAVQQFFSTHRSVQCAIKLLHHSFIVTTTSITGHQPTTANADSPLTGGQSASAIA